MKRENLEEAYWYAYTFVAVGYVLVSVTLKLPWLYARYWTDEFRKERLKKIGL